MPPHSNLGDRARTCLKKREKNPTVNIILNDKKTESISLNIRNMIGMAILATSSHYFAEESNQGIRQEIEKQSY